MYRSTGRFRTNTIFAAAAMRDKNADTTIEPEVYLCQLDGVWKLPNAFYYQGDRSQNVAPRIQNEFGVRIDDGFNKPVGIKWDERTKTTILTEVFIVMLADDPQIDDSHKWFSTDSLPADMDEFHRKELVPLAVAAYKAGTPRNSG